MTKPEIVQSLQDIIGEEKVTKVEAERIWFALIEVIAEEVKKGGEINFGSLFKVYKKHKNERMVRNPKTQEKFLKAARDELGCKILKKGKTLIQD